MLDRIEIGFGMDAYYRRAVAERCRLANQRLKALVFQDALDRAQAVRTLGMAAAHVVTEAGGMREK
jgi:hypothetical protein